MQARNPAHMRMTLPTPFEWATARALTVMPTIATGQADDLKFETKGRRIWLSRCTVDDGEPCDNKITLERFATEYTPNKWVTVGTYFRKVMDWWECGWEPNEEELVKALRAAGVEVVDG